MKLEELKSEFEAVQENLGQAFERFPWENQEAYISWLAQTYEYAVCSTRILAMAAGRFPKEMTPHSNRFIAHAAEEKNHDLLLLNDAKKLDTDIKSVPVLAEAEAFHKSLYYYIYNGSPVTLYGWVLALEGLAVRKAKQAYARAEKAHGQRASMFLKVHTEEDEGHLESAFKAVSDLSEEDLDRVCHGMKFFGKLYENMVYAAARDSVRRETLSLAA